MCHTRALPPQTQSNHPKPRNTTSPNSSKNISPHAAHLTITHPLIPSQEGKPPHHKPLIYNEKTVFQTSPLERGRGCVTPVHSLLKPKAVTQSRQILHNSTNNNKCNISQQLSKNISSHTAPLTVTHPLNPLSRGETNTPQITHYQQENSVQTSPSQRGAGGV